MLYIILSFINITILTLCYLKYRKNLKHLQTQINNNGEIIKSSTHIYSQDLKGEINKLSISVKQLESKLSGRIDGRSLAIYRQIDNKNEESILKIKEILLNWENSEEFKMMLNSIKSKELKEDRGFTY
tara:strand:+ start:344 stop:727 length:384 start_codon:yes stop_codon:yes gene_type:complete